MIAIWTRVILIAAFAILAGSVSPAADPPPTDQSRKVDADPKPIPDSAITRAIERRFQRNAMVPFDSIDVATETGIVTLTGRVDNLLAKKEATTVARETRGVRAVVNRITVAESNRADERTLKDVQTALTADPALVSCKLTPSVAQGIVTLTGTTRSWMERELAEEDTAGVQGVINIHNQIQVKPIQSRPDAEVASDIRERLKWDRRVRGAHINVQVKDDKVRLIGSVGSAVERWMAFTDAWVNGVAAVNIDDLKVDQAWNRKPDRNSAAFVRTEEGVEQAIKDAWSYDPRVSLVKPAISATDGIVTLRGTVNNLAARQAAAADARNTVGVWRVCNLIKVRPSKTVPDANILRNVQLALSHDPHGIREEVRVSVRKGYVFLHGAVHSYSELEHAGADAARVDGVVGVRNYLTVSPPEEIGPFTPTDITARDNAIRGDIQDEMRWSPFVAKDEVVVTVRDGVATLTGFVDTLAEKQAATRCAYDGGARKVINELKVHPAPGLAKP